MKEITIEGDNVAVKDDLPTLGYTKASALPKKGIVINALYLGSFTGGKYGSTTHYLKLNDGSLNVTAGDEQIKAKAGDKVGLSGTKILNKKLALVSRNTNIKIEFTGMEEFQTKAGETAREAKFKVFADESDGTVAVDAAEADIFAS
jgi:hypothetical protein